LDQFAAEDEPVAPEKDLYAKVPNSQVNLQILNNDASFQKGDAIDKNIMYFDYANGSQSVKHDMNMK